MSFVNNSIDNWIDRLLQISPRLNGIIYQKMSFEANILSENVWNNWNNCIKSDGREGENVNFSKKF